MKSDIKNRDDVHLLVSAFYKKVRQNQEIGFFFNNSIKNWEEHINKLTDFWESSLFFVSKYSGNPQKAHIEVDVQNNQQIKAEHFGIWMNLWFETIDDYFEGELAQRAKNNARKMSTHLNLKIFQNRG